MKGSRASQLCESLVTLTLCHLDSIFLYLELAGRSPGLEAMFTVQHISAAAELAAICKHHLASARRSTIQSARGGLAAHADTDRS